MNTVCEYYPKYKAVYKPKCSCTACWDRWKVTQLEDYIKKLEEDLKVV